MLTEEYDNHIRHSHNQEQRDRFGIKTEEKPGPKGHFYGDVWSKYEQQPYTFTPAEFDAISNEAWEGEGCEICTGIVQSTETSGEDYIIYPTPDQKRHMTDIFGYAAEPAVKPTGYLDPEDPQWQQSVEHIQERYKGGPLGSFGPQSGMMRGEPTRDEWQITSYLDGVGVTYIHKMKLRELDPSIERERLEYDIYIPEYHMAIETSPGWHEGGPSEKSFPDVVENDRFKREFAEERGIDLMSFDPAKGTENFINGTLVPKLRAVGVDAFEVTEGKKEQEDLSTEGRTYGDPRFNEWDTPFIYREEEEDKRPESWGRVKHSTCVCHDPPNNKTSFCDECDMHHHDNDWMEDHLEIQSMREVEADFGKRDEQKGVGYDWDYNTKYRDKPILEESEQSKPIGDSWKVKGQTIRCSNCGKEKELCDICNYHHHADNFMGEHEKFQMIVNSGGLDWNKLPSQLQAFEEKYGTAFPCPMDIDPEDMGTFQKEEQSGIPQNIPTGAYTRLEPLTQDQSQNFPRYPERGKVNTIEQQSGGEELEAQNILKLEEEIKELESQV
jgi:hypothetical protein